MFFKIMELTQTSAFSSLFPENKTLVKIELRSKKETKIEYFQIISAKHLFIEVLSYSIIT